MTLTTQEKREMSSTPAILARSLTRPSPRQARKLRRYLREIQPEVHATLKKLRREQRCKKREQLAEHVNHARKVWVGMCKVKERHLDKDGDVDVRRFPGAFTPSPRR